MPKSHSLEVADNGTKSHIGKLKIGLFYKIPAGCTTGQRTIDPRAQVLKPRLEIEVCTGAAFLVLTTP